MKRAPTLIPIEVALPLLKNEDEARAFLVAMLSEQEFQQLRNRWAAYQHRAQGMTLAEIARTTGIATATANRAAKLFRDSPEILQSVIDRAERRRRVKRLARWQNLETRS